MNAVIRPYGDEHMAWAEALIGAEFGGRIQARMGTTIDALVCPGLVAEVDGEPAGILTFDRDADDVEVVYLHAATPRRGVGTALIAAVEEATHPERLWLVATNDNVDALRFYQRRGFRICEIRCGAVDEARRTLKPGIPEVGSYGIAMRDEIVLERRARLLRRTS